MLFWNRTEGEKIEGQHQEKGGGSSNIETVAMAMEGGDLISRLIRSPPSLR